MIIIKKENLFPKEEVQRMRVISLLGPARLPAAVFCGVAGHQGKLLGGQVVLFFSCFSVFSPP